MDCVPHFLLGRSDRTESQEDMWLVCQSVHHLYSVFPFVVFLTSVSVSPPCSFRTQTFAYPESSAEREEILQGLQSRIEDIKSVSGDVETFSTTENTRRINIAVVWVLYPFLAPHFSALTSLCWTGVVTDWELPAAAADASRGRPAQVEGAGTEVQSDPDGPESMQPVRHWQMPDRGGLVSCRQAARAAECSERGRGKTKQTVPTEFQSEFE